MKKTLLVILIVGLSASALGFGLMHTFANGGDQDILIKKDDSDSLEVELDFGAGEIMLSGGSKEWVSGSTVFNSRKLKPKVEYKSKRGTGKVKIKQSSSSTFGINLKEFKNTWDLQLTDDIPVSLDIDMGASDAELDLRGIQLTDLKIDSGVGDSTIDLSGERKESFDAKIDVGVGDATIILPKETGLKLKVSKGLGNVNVDGLISKGNGIYVNESYENADVIIDLTVDIGVGNVDFIVK